MLYAFYSTQPTDRLFEHAVRRGIWQRIKRKLKHKPTRLIDFNQRQLRTRLRNQSDHGIETIPVKQIVGSLGRTNEFDRDFMPMDKHIKARWQNIIHLFLRDVPLPPIEVYRLSDEYFVIDGNHRISVSQFLGIEYIDAHIIELHEAEEQE